MHRDEHRSPFGLGMLSVLFAALMGACRAPAAAATETTVVQAPTSRLSAASSRVLRAATGVTITAYFSPGMPPPFDATEARVRDLLNEIRSVAPDTRIQLVDCDTDEERSEAERLGVALVEHAIVGGTDEVVEGYRGLVVERGGEHRVVSVVPPDMRGVEHDLTAAVRGLTAARAPVGVLAGHGSPTLAEGLTTLASLARDYELREVSAATELPADLRALLIIEPVTALSEAELRNIDELVMRGASLGVLGGGITVDVEGSGPELEGRASQGGVNRLLERWGVRIEPNLVLDEMCGRVPMRTSMGIAVPVPYPPAPVFTVSDDVWDHPVLFRLDGLPLFFVSQITTSDGFAAVGTVLLRSSGDASWLLSGDPVSVAIRSPRAWESTMEQGERGPFTVAVALEGQLPSAFDTDGGAPRRSVRPVRVAVVGTSSMLRDEFLPTSVPEAELRASMALPFRMIDWLAQDADLVAIRTSPWPER